MMQRGLVGTLGVFDGVHRGHRALVETVVARARETGGPACVITFHPHPVAVLAPDSPPQRVLDVDSQAELLLQLGVDLLWRIPFSRDVSRIDAEDFVAALAARLRPVELWIGYDFRFGRARRGDFDLMAREGARHGFGVHRFDAVQEPGTDAAFSSSRIREALREGRVEAATAMLGHDYWIDGTVERGRGDGARLLVPTANLRPARDLLLPGNGVYAATAELDGVLHPAAVNVGTRPTLTEDRGATVEVHLIDWGGDLYGRKLRVRLARRIRGERRFDGLDALRRGIERDIEAVRAWERERAADGRNREPRAPKT